MNSEKPIENEDKPAVFQRPDKRKPYEYRLLKIKFGHEWGNCTVTLGNTQIMVQLFHNIVRPKQYRPHKGKFQIHLNLTGQAQVSSEITKIKEVLKKFYIKSKYIDLKALCITPGEKVWNIVVELRVMTMDGNVIGCSSAAILASLMYFRYSDVGTENVAAQNAPLKPLLFHQHPVVTSFAIFGNNDIIVMDPSLEEESKCNNQIFVAFNDKHKLCGVKKEDGVHLSYVYYMNCLNCASTITYRMLDFIKSAVDKAIKDRLASSTSAESLESTVTEDFKIILRFSNYDETENLSNKEKNEEMKGVSHEVDNDGVNHILD